VGAGDGEVTRELDLSNILNSCVEVLGGATSIDVGEEVRRLDGVVSSTRPGEVVWGGPESDRGVVKVNRLILSMWQRS